MELALPGGVQHDSPVCFPDGGFLLDMSFFPVSPCFEMDNIFLFASYKFL